jgi:small subunit ribosomal protein S1
MSEFANTEPEAPPSIPAMPAGGEGSRTESWSTGDAPSRAEIPSATATAIAPTRAAVLLVNADDDEEPSAASGAFLDMVEDTLREIKEGEIVRGRVLKVGESEVLVDVGFKSEGVIALAEFPDPGSIKEGDEIDVFLEKMENRDGLVVLSKQRADFLRVWGRIKEAYDAGEIVKGKLMRRIKGGVVVDLFGVDAFLPGSQIALRQVANLDELIGHTYDFKIIKLNKRRRNIVVSRRVVLEEERNRQKASLISELEKEQIREGVVKNITDFGAFVDLGGIDGLLHITDMSWGRVAHPSEIVKIGDKIKVKVLEFDREKERISLGLKQLTPYPWEKVESKYPVGTRIKGRVVSITDYGAFIEIEKGIEGLVHVSEMSWTRTVRHPSKILNQGDIIEAVVLKVDRENEKISLGLKQTEPDPWLSLDLTYPIGSRVSGKVRNLTNFGAFVELAEGIDGLVHISDMSWTRRIRHANEVLKKGDTVEVMVLNIDKENRRISLGLKQVQQDPWDGIATRFPEGTYLNAKVLRVMDRGVVVDLGDEIEGFMPASQVGNPNVKKLEAYFREGDELSLKVIKVDPQNRRIVLSEKAFLTDQDKSEVDAYMRRFADRQTTIADAVGEIAEHDETEDDEL